MSQSTLTFNSVMVQNEKLNDVERILKEMARPTRVSVEAATKLETGARGTGLLETERFDKFFNTFVITSRSEFRSQYDEMKENRDVKALKKKKLFKQCQKMARPITSVLETRSLSQRLIALFRKIIDRKFNQLLQRFNMHQEEITRMQGLHIQKETSIFLLQRKVEELEEAADRDRHEKAKIKEELKIQKEILLKLIDYTMPKCPPKPQNDGLIIGIYNDSYFMN